jgi:chemotaxis protein CheD
MANAPLIVGLGDIKVSKDPQAIIRAIGLGSCIGIIAVSPRRRVAGMAHVVLPQSSIDPKKAEQKPGYFADTAVEGLLEAFKPFGVRNPRELMVKIAGGASIMDQNRAFDIGKRNILAVKKALMKNRLVPIAEDVGRNFSRTVWIDVATGLTYIRTAGKPEWEL